GELIAESTFALRIDSTPARIELKTPRGGEAAARGEHAVISGVVTEDDCTLEIDSEPIPLHDREFSTQVELSKDEDSRFVLRVTDRAGNRSERSVAFRMPTVIGSFSGEEWGLHLDLVIQRHGNHLDATLSTRTTSAIIPQRATYELSSEASASEE